MMDFISIFLKTKGFYMIRLIRFICALALLGANCVNAQQAQVPSLIRIIVPFAAGGSTDVIARSLASQLSVRLNTTVIVENRTGGGGLIGASIVAKGAKDGSVLLLSTASLATAAATVKSVSFDLNSDLLPVAELGEGPMVVAVSTKTNIKTPLDLLAAARAKPDELTHGTAGVGSISQLTVELLNDMAKAQMKHIPYKGSALALIDLASGTIDMMVAINTTLSSQIKANRVRIIGVTTLQPSPAFPGVLPMASAVPGFDVDYWVGVFAPVGTPANLMQRYNREINEIAKSKEVADQLAFDGQLAKPLTSEEFGSRVRRSYDTWRRISIEKKIVAE
jgi:tripartite-type tricarboxylate transporter receptor subunit TctC